MRRRDFIVTFSGAIAWPLAAWAAERVRRVGGLMFGSGDSPLAQSFTVGLREELARLGWVEGRNLRIDYRYATGDRARLAAYAEELVNSRPDVILAIPGSAIQAVQQLTQVIPIVFAGGGDAVDNGYVNSVARPAGNTTGFANVFTSQGGKWLELLKEAVPHITRVASIFDGNLRSDSPMQLTIADAAPKLALMSVRIPLRSPAEIERDISAFAAEPNGAMLWTSFNMSPDKVEAINRLALQYRLPMMAGGSPIVADGILMSQGPPTNELAVRGIASYIDRILRGAKPSDLPIQYPTKFELIVNLKVAKAIGVTIPETFLTVRADKVIE